MNARDARAIDRLFKQLARPPRRRSGLISMAPISLALGLLVGHRLLGWFVPMVWSSMLPGGFEQALRLGGAPSLLARLAWLVHVRSANTAVILGVVAVSGFVVSTFLRPLRFLVWLAGVAALLLDAGIVIVTLHTALVATAAEAGFG